MSFASASLARHLARGGVGAGALALAIGLATAHPALAFGAFALGLAALRGCPLCWTIGLGQTLIRTVRGRSLDGLCRDGRCALAERTPRGES